MFKFFKRKKQQRSFAGAQVGRLNDFVMSYQRIDADLRQSYSNLVLRARNLAHDDPNVISALLTMERNIIGANGFRIQSRTGDNVRNNTIERLWKSYCKSKITLDRKNNARDFDIQILRTLIVDGEVFVRRIFENGIPHYELIDSLDVDVLYNVEDCGDGCRISMGIKLDSFNAPVSYFIRVNTNSYSYNTGDRIEVPASEIIHIYRSYFAGQTRGYTMLSGSLIRLNHLDAYDEAELISARMEACNQGFFKRQQDGIYDELAENKTDEQFPEKYEPGTIRKIPDGYDLIQLQSNHPNSNFGAFVKNILRRVSASIGLSYNKVTGDYEAVNYSSLREAALEDRETWKDIQEFLIDNWKQVQFRDFANAMIARRVFDFVDAEVEFFGRTWDWIDPVKDITAIKMKLDMRLTDPITEIEKMGGDPETTVRRWQEWQRLTQDITTGENNDNKI
jgi:lambda family phage portal protein